MTQQPRGAFATVALSAALILALGARTSSRSARAAAGPAPGAGSILAEADLSPAVEGVIPGAERPLFAPALRGDGEFWSAPNAFLGDRSAALDGLLEVRLQLSDGTWNADAEPDVLLVGDAATLANRLHYAPGRVLTGRVPYTMIFTTSRS